MKRINQSNHDQMVRGVYNHLIANGYNNVKADLTGLTRPDLICWSSTTKGYIPDVTAGSNGASMVIEVETDDSIYDQHTEDQWRLFAANAEQHGKTFVVVVPKASESTARTRLAQLVIQAQIWSVG